MKQVAIQFSSVVELIDFVHDVTAKQCEVNEDNNTLTCDLSQNDLERAVSDYGATICNVTDDYDQ